MMNLCCPFFSQLTEVEGLEESATTPCRRVGVKVSREQRAIACCSNFVNTPHGKVHVKRSRNHCLLGAQTVAQPAAIFRAASCRFVRKMSRRGCWLCPR